MKTRNGGRCRAIFTLSIVLLLPLCAPLVPWVVAAEAPSVAPVNPAFEEYLAKRKQGAVSLLQNELPRGYIPTPMQLPAPSGAMPAGVAGPLVLPSFYDLRTQGKLSPIRDQGSCGDCWAFGAYSSLESCLLTNESWDFSENNLNVASGFDFGCCNGGHQYMSTAYLARWSGPVSQSDDPETGTGCTTVSGVAARKHVQEVLFLPVRTSATDNDTIKQAVMTYGAVDTAILVTGGAAYLPPYSDAYYNASTYAYYYNGTDAVDHEIAIVGWDDNFAASNFSTVPPGNGAFIMRNSWGTAWGQSGYFYMSYYDTQVGRVENSVFLSPDSTSKYSRIYQYDPLGWVNSFGCGTPTGWGANVFTAVGAEQLRAVSLYTPVVNATYAIYIYLSPGSSPTSGTLASSTSGTIAQPGYHTIALPTPVKLAASQKFSIVVRFTTTGYNYPIPVEYAISGYSSAATASAGQSYLSCDGSSWTDATALYSTMNVCIKGFTSVNDVRVAVTASPNPVLVGSNLTYNVSLANSGPAWATSVTVTDPVPAGVTFNSATASQGTCTNQGGTIICSLGTLDSNTTATVSISVTPTLVGALTNTVTVTASEPDTNPGNNAATNITTITVSPPTVTQQPFSTNVCAGAATVFAVAATGTGPLTYQWQTNSVNLSNGGHYTGVTTSNLTVSAADSSVAASYRCLISNSGGSVTSSVASLTVNPTSVGGTTTPTAGTVCSGIGTTITLASQTGTIVKWQSSPDNAAWSDIASTDNPYPTGALTATTYFRAMVQSGVCPPANSSVAMVTVNFAPSVSSSPTNLTICAGALASFNAAATGSPAPSMQWQASLDGGGSWNNLNGATTATYSFSAGMGDTGHQYRAIFSNACGTTNSAAATLTVQAGQLGVSPVEWNFEAVATGTTVQTSFTVTNAGCGQLSGTATSTAPFAVVRGSPFTLPGFGATNVMVSFTPSVEGWFTNRVVFTSDGGVSTNQVIGHGAIAPIALFSASPTNGVASLTVIFTDTSTGTITNRFWDFGNGTTNTTAASVTNTYAAGTYTVSLMASGPLGASTNTQTNLIAVNPSGGTGRFAGWARKMRISFSGYTRSEDLVNFPALVSLGANLSGFSYADFASATGGDLRFAAADEQTELNYEVERWDTNGTSQVWVEVPALNSNTWIWAYWGNVASNAPPACTTNGSVWANGYVGVWHMTEPNIHDSTATPITGISAGTANAPGIVGVCQSFDGTSASITSACPPELAGNPSLTVSYWLRYEAQPGRQWLLDIGGKSSWNDVHFMINTDNSAQFGFWNGSQNAFSIAGYAGIWAHYATAYQPGAGATITSYVNGQQVDTDPVSATPNLSVSGGLRFGLPGVGGESNFKGQMDEVRIGNVTRSANWIWAEWCNMASNGVFNSYAPVQNTQLGTDSDGDGVPDWWMQQYFGHPTGLESDHSRAGDDPDGDGMSNLQEYLAGTNPTNSASAFRIISVAQEGDNIRVTWSAGGGRTNMVETASSLSGSYSNLSANILISGSGDTTTNYLDIGGVTNAPARFYRVRLVP